MKKLFLGRGASAIFLISVLVIGGSGFASAAQTVENTTPPSGAISHFNVPTQTPYKSSGRHNTNIQNEYHAGYDALTPYALDYTTTDFIVPSLTCPSGTNYFSSAWAGEGTGNDSSHPLFQTGVGMLCTNGVASYVPWWEMYPNNNEQDYTTGGTPSAGDKIVAEIVVSGSNAYFYLDDYGSNLSNTIPVKSWGHTYNNFSTISIPSVESCIVEDPLVNVTHPYLTNFGSVDFSRDSSGSFNQACDVTANDQDNIISSSSTTYNHILSSSTINTYDMYDSTLTDELASTTGPSTNGYFEVDYVNPY